MNVNVFEIKSARDVINSSKKNNKNKFKEIKLVN